MPNLRKWDVLSVPYLLNDIWNINIEATFHYGQGHIGTTPSEKWHSHETADWTLKLGSNKMLGYTLFRMS